MISFREDIIKELQNIRRGLLDLSKRNRLLNFRHSRLCIPIVDEQPGHVFDYLVKRGKSMTFLALPENPELEERESEKDTTETQVFKKSESSLNSDLSDNLPLPEYADGTVPEKHRDDKLQTKLQADFLETRLRRMHSAALTLIQETGKNQLFLALGFLRWKERTDTEGGYEAPLILVPIEIERGKLDRRAQRYTYNIQYTGEDLVPNLSLREKLLKDYNLILPMFNDEHAVVVADTEEELDPKAYFESIANATADMSGWEVKRKMVVGFFAFAKLRMYLDLDPSEWPKSSHIADHELIRRLLGFEGQPSDKVEDAGGDESSELDSQPLVLDADSSQKVYGKSVFVR